MIKIMNKTHILSIVLLFFTAIFVSTAASEDIEKTDSKELSAEVQNQKAVEVFESILKFTENSSRSEVLPKMEAEYLRIIKEYPKASLVPECYWRLVLMYLNDYNPPAVEKAEALYGEFIKKNPDSALKPLIEEALSKNYFHDLKWEKILRLYTPAIKQFIEKGNKPRVYELFMYTEAKLNLGDLEEAEKGYKIIIDQFVGTPEAREAIKRLEKIKEEIRRNKENKAANK
jgi:outer membrane protein assembly factor BamD (BamD/ComL family)